MFFIVCICHFLYIEKTVKVFFIYTRKLTSLYILCKLYDLYKLFDFCEIYELCKLYELYKLYELCI